MPSHHYMFRLPDGQTHQSARTPAQIRKQYPEAVITHRVEVDAAGNPVLTPFTGQQSAVSPEDVKESTDSVQSDDDSQRNPAKRTSKKAS